MSGDLAPIREIEGVRLIETEKKQTELSELISATSIHAVLAHLRKSRRTFAIYDPYYPSPSDPGAYLKYSPAGPNPSTWRIVFGNHGWSGGIYEVDEVTICAQLKNLASRGLLNPIDLDNVGSYSNYALEDDATNQIMAQKIASLHAGT